MTKRILVTGGTGFAGSHLVEALLARGYSDVHVTSYNGDAGPLTGKISANQVHQIDLTNTDATTQLLQKLQPQHIYHLAAFATVANSFAQAEKVMQDNSRLQLNLLEAVRQVSPQSRVLVVGSGMEYDVMHLRPHELVSEKHALGPISPYAISKVVQDLLSLSYVYSYKLDIVRARPFNHIGERQTADFAVPSFAQQIVAIERGEQTEIQVGNLDAIRDFTDVKDIAVAYILLMETGKSGDVYNIGSGRGITMKTVLEKMCALSSVTVKVVTDPNRVRPLDVPAVIADSKKIQQLGWETRIPLEATLTRVLDEWRAKTPAPTQTRHAAQ